MFWRKLIFLLFGYHSKVFEIDYGFRLTFNIISSVLLIMSVIYIIASDIIVFFSLLSSYIIMILVFSLFVRVRRE